jgi:hypothetical protein
VTAIQNVFEVIRFYPKLKTHFDALCKVASEWLNGNQQIPSVSFAASADGSSAQLTALGETFSVSFRVLMHKDTPCGVFQVSIPETAHQAERVLWRVFFDDLGNVRRSLSDAVALPHLLSDREFLKLLLSETLGSYFPHVLASESIE